MSTYSFAIAGRDYERAGAATARVKEMLRRVGVDPASVRRAMIAAYEAEMNVVIHANGGRMDVRLSPERLSVDVIDEGPGIPNVEKALTEGFSTAGEEARALGFGAGMGLPNIQRNTDAMTIRTQVGRGTHLHFAVDLHEISVLDQGDAPNSLMIREERCRRCLACVRACPTQAMRLRPKGPEVLGHLCVDCAECIRACPTGALSVRDNELDPVVTTGQVLVTQPFFEAEFDWEPEDWSRAVAQIGFRETCGLEHWEAALVDAAVEWAAGNHHAGPTIVPTCPAAVNLIATRFPALLGHVAPFASPVAAAASELAERRTQIIVACPAQKTAVETSASNAPVSLVPAALREAFMNHRPKKRTAPADAAQNHQDRQGVWSVSGAGHVIRALESIERGEWPQGDVLAFDLCDGGCFGTPLSLLDTALSRRRWFSRSHPARTAGVIRLKAPPTPRTGRRLADNMAQAMDRLRRIDRIARGLPGTNCAACGAPSCEALAEDIVLERAAESDCPWRTPREEKPS